MSSTAFEKAFDAGLAAQKRGDLRAALSSYEQALEENPDDAEALSLYGAALLQAGRQDEAEDPLLKAVELSPDLAGFRANLAHYYHVTGDLERAEAEFRKATELKPDFAPGWRQLGEVLIAKQEFELAADALDQALQLAPDNLALCLRLVRAQAAAGNYPAAFYGLEHADKIKPDARETLVVRMDLARFNRDWPGLERFAEQFVAGAPDQPEGWRDLSLAFYERGRIRAALEAFEKVLETDGRSLDNLTVYGRIALQAGCPEVAAAALDEAEKLGSNVALSAYQALRYLGEGDLEKALAYCERAVDEDPTFTSVYPHLSALRQGKLKDIEIAALTGHVEDATRAAETRARAAFVLAHHLDANDDFEAAFAEYQRANELAAEHRRDEQVAYDPGETEQHFEVLIRRFSDRRDFERRPGANEEGAPTPIFITGAPRSGTTLIEFVLGSHSAVHAGGELPMMLTILMKHMQRSELAGPLDDSELAAYVGGYWSQAPEMGEARFLTDKALLNMQAVGLIAQMFPDSPIIRVRRNPLEAGLSIYRHEFVKFMAFTDSLENIAHFLAQNERLAAHWSEVLGDRFRTIQYERFAGDFDKEARNLVASVGLDWEEACGERQTIGSATISAAQVHEPVELRAGRAKAYERFLEPLAKTLEEYGIDPDTGAFKE